MKKKFFTLLVALFGSLTLSAAERVAPTLPDFVTFESGKDYYLYNVGAQGFLAPLSSSASYSGISETGIKATVTMLSEGCYTVQFKETGNYWRNSGGTKMSMSSYSEKYCGWNFIPTSNENEYNIQVAIGKQYYNETQYVGTQTGDEQVYPNLTTENNIAWKLIDGATGDLYCARVRLYNALEAMNSTNYDIEKFEEIYADANSTVQEIENAATILNNANTISSNFMFPDWNDYPILLERSTDNKWKCNSGNNYVRANCSDGGSTLTATVVVVDADATLSFEAKEGGSLKILVDGVEKRILTSKQLARNYYTYGNEYSPKAINRHFIELTPGKHTIQWIASTHSSDYYIYNIGVETTPQITVNLLEPGSLGTEILYNVNHLKDVRKLKIIGEMNDDDWAKIDMMSENLYILDLSETKISEITDSRFREWPFLHSVKLPEGLKRIGKSAFYLSLITDIEIPSTVEEIGSSAFAYSNVEKAMLPEGCMTLEESIFKHCKFLKKTSLPSKLTAIPYSMYYCCYYLNLDKLPYEIKTIDNRAFFGCWNISFDLPESLTSIGTDAFNGSNQYGKKTQLIIPKNVTSIGSDAFASTDYTCAEFPTSYYRITASTPISDNIKTIKLNSPTVVEHPYDIISDDMRAEVTLQVPSFLVNAYKLDEYWYNFKSIEGFPTEDIKEWKISKDLVLGARDRMLGTPSLTFTNTGGLKINGEDEMPINNLYLNVTPTSNTSSGANYSRIFSNADGVTIAGELMTCMDLRHTNFWYYLCLPYDIKVSDINNGAGGLYAVRYYDGANRAINGATGNWKNYDKDAIIPAGTGFIIQVNTTGSWYFPAQNNASKQYITSNKIFAKELAENASENVSDQGWNLIGNPYQSWYNIHKLNFTAPITVRTYNNKYEAYSVIDDDYALAPNQAFFVQRPSEVTSISFPLDGRQLTSEITDQNNAPSVNPQAPGRLLTDIVVSNGTDTDRTRVVLNEKATTLYDMGSDANKFMAENANVPQIYTIDNNGTQYAINERPVADGVVRLGFRSNGGSFVFSLARNMSEKVVLIDNVTGQETDLTQQDYSFTADAATCDNRFEVRFFGGATGVDNLSCEKANVTITDNGISITNASGLVEVFNVNGMKVAAVSGNGNVQLSAGVYVVKTAGLVKKVVVK